jgi:3-hydroxybutyryl-CoA dehydrogenase
MDQLEEEDFVFDKIEDVKHVGIIGAGLMGHGIAQAFAMHGYMVSIFDADKQVLKTVPDRIYKNLQVFHKLRKIKKSEIEKCISNINLCDDLGSLSDTIDFIIEAIKENLDAKVALFEDLERRIDSNVIISSNTSAISINRLSDRLKYKQRFLGTHFWNPPHIIPCVEVIRGEHTSDTVFETVFEMMKRIGKEPVKVLKDVPGFLGNRLQHAMWREAISLVEKKIASPEDIDKVVKYGFGLRLSFIGPLETADLAGLDLDYDVHKYLFPYLENASEPSPALKSMVDQGLLGVKTGRGFYEWPEEKINKIIDQRDLVLLKIINQVL